VNIKITICCAIWQILINVSKETAASNLKVLTFTATRPNEEEQR
jgi:hypothetical protein